MKRFLSISLTLCLGAFLGDAVVSLLDDSLILVLGLRVLAPLRGMTFLLAALSALAAYLLMGLTPMVPKRWFVPITLFGPVTALLALPTCIYWYDRLALVAWLVSLCQVGLGLLVLHWTQGALRLSWPLIRADHLGGKTFGWLNLSGFALVNLGVLLPGLVLYLGWCASLAVDHYSAGFVVLRSSGLAMRARTYARSDGKTVQLVPMMHIGEAGFYRQILHSFPTNSILLLEGVTDQKKLLKHKLTYKRMASSLGLTQQPEKLMSAPARRRPADIDVSEFSEGTIRLLDLAAWIHAEGLNVRTVAELLQQSQDPRLADQLWQDILHKRNAHLLQEIRLELGRSDVVVVPWGAAHMPGVSREIERSGFKLVASREFVAVRFRTLWDKRQPPFSSQGSGPASPAPVLRVEPP